MLGLSDEDAVCCARGLGLETCIGRRGCATLFRNDIDYDSSCYGAIMRVYAKQAPSSELGSASSTTSDGIKTVLERMWPLTFFS
jgi:hypothetical protein